MTTVRIGRPGKPPQHFADLDLSQRRQLVADAGFPTFRANQISHHLFSRHTLDHDDWTDIPAADRATMAGLATPPLLERQTIKTGDDGDTVKYLWRLHDGALIESVLMRYPSRITMCISSQAGCGMNCPFCATGQAGLTRNLSTAEIVWQVVEGMADLSATNERVSNIVFMGMGEPLANYRSTLAAVRRLIADPPEGLGLAGRNVTVSTVGLVPQVRKLAEEKLQITLALSLHAPDDELRNELVPINNRYPLAEVWEALWDYTEITGRRVSIEYALIRDINDQQWRAAALAEALRGRLAHVNLIPLNPTPGSKWTASDPAVQDTFVQTLRSAGISTTVRDTRGQDIDGACGQLAASSAT